METKIRYKKPPILERIIGVYRPISQEVFDQKLPGWVEQIKDFYPRAEPIAEWEIEIENKNGIPLVKNLAPKAKIIHLFWKNHSAGLKVLGMRVRPDRLVFHLRRENENPHDFDELYPEMERWIQPWATHFGIESLTGITVEYVNRINGNITPQLMQADGSIHLGGALNIFAQIPGDYEGLTRPYECNVRLVIDQKIPCFFDVKIAGEDGESASMKIAFAATTIDNARSIAFSKALEEIKFGHELMLRQFDCFFTDTAKLSFEPDAIRTGKS
jgi:hypothetical protein